MVDPLRAAGGVHEHRAHAARSGGRDQRGSAPRRDVVREELEDRLPVGKAGGDSIGQADVGEAEGEAALGLPEQRVVVTGNASTSASCGRQPR